MQASSEVRTKLVDILSRVLELEKDEIQGSSRLRTDLGADSMDYNDIGFRVRRAFAVRLPGLGGDSSVLNLSLAEALKRDDVSDGLVPLLVGLEAGEFEGLVPDESGRFPRSLASMARLLARMTVRELATAARVEVPPELDGDASVDSLQVEDLYLFVTVDLLTTYVERALSEDMAE